ncbi:MAG: TolC family protein [Elusimicrobia bacterium]|nr:TolC family protein [Elusimicrobiota bacterium]
MPFAFVAVSPAWPASTATWALQDVVQEARRASPAAREARARWEAAAAAARGSGALPDPMAELGSKREPGDERMVSLGVSQDFPFPGKRGLERRSAEAAAAQLGELARAAEAEAAASARVLYHRLNLLDETAGILERTSELLRGVVKSAEARLASAKGELGDAFIAQTELEEVRNRLFEARRQRLLEEAAFNALLGRPVQGPVGPTRPPELEELTLPLEKVQDMARAASPELGASRWELALSTLERSRGRYAWAPDFRAGYERMRMAGGGEGGWSWKAGVSLPLWTARQRAEAAAAPPRAEERSAAAERMRLEVEREVAREYVEVRTHLQLARNGRDVIIPLAQGAVDVLRRGYEAGKTDILKVLESARTLLRTELEYQEQVYHYGEHWALLERWAGRSLPAGGRP